MNNKHILVVNFNKEILKELQYFPLVIKITDLADIEYIKKNYSKNYNLHTLLIENIFHDISTFPYSLDWININITVYLNTLGNFKEFIHKLDIIRNLNIIIFLESNFYKNYENLQMISSLGINCGITFDNNYINWEKLNNLMTYAVYSKTNHAPIQPFDYIIQNYDPQKLLNFSSVFFNNPEKYLHIDNEFNISLSKEELYENKYIGNGIETIININNNQNYKNRIRSWQDYFLTMNDCSVCSSWRICMGYFSHLEEKEYKCKKFFKDMLEACDFHNNNN